MNEGWKAGKVNTRKQVVKRKALTPTVKAFLNKNQPKHMNYL
jgi:hypothetical protein